MESYYVYCITIYEYINNYVIVLPFEAEKSKSSVAKTESTALE